MTPKRYCTTKTNMGLKWYQSTAYDLPMSRLVFVFFNLKALGPFN
jgi:hypothetical protein